jgi:peptide/nickel transport system substrate-binding protein
MTLSKNLLRSCLLTSLFVLPFGVAAHAQDSTLRIRINADIRSSNPGVNRDANTDMVMMHVVEGLVGYKEDSTIGNMLAESVDVSEDGRVYTFKLRDGITFHNGAPLTSEDVLFSWKRYTDPANAWRCLSDVNGQGLSHVVDVQAPDAKTVVFTLEKPAALFLATLARTDCAGTGIYHRGSVDASGNWIKPIGTGPFKFENWVSSQYIELARNENYTALSTPRDGMVGDKTPLVDKVRFVIIPDDSATKAALLSGGIDIISDVSNTDIAELSANETVKTDKAQGMGLNVFLFQTRDPLLSDVRIRKAIELSMDYAEIATVVTEGQAEPGHSVIPRPSSYFKTAQAELPSRDIEEAKKLLKEAGYAGQPIEWITSKQYPALFDAAVLAQAMASEAGINLDIKVLDWATLQDHYNNGTYQAMSMTYSSRLDPSLSFDMMSGNKDKQPRKVWDNPEALELLAKSKEISDPAARQEIFDKLEAMYRADVPMISLYSGTKTAAVRTVVQGYKGWAVGQPRAWGVSLETD